jgi:hypothetical protein
MSSPRITYAQRDDTSTAAEVAALATIYSFVLMHANKDALGVTSTKGDDAKGSRHEVRANEASIPR